MTIEQLRNAHQARPFRPFVLNLSDGRHYEVINTEFLSHSPSGRTIVVHLPDDRIEIVDLLHVVSLNLANGQVQALS